MHLCVLCNGLIRGAWAISFTPLSLGLSDETLQAVVPFYLVFMPGGVKKIPLRWLNV